MSNLPHYIADNINKDKNYYSLYKFSNIERCKVDSDYLGEVILANEKLIWHSVYKYIGNVKTIIKHNAIEYEDILQLGREGFIKAIFAFDTQRNIKFSSFAVTAIVREIRCFLRDGCSIIRLTRTAFNLLREIKKLRTDLGFMPSSEDIALLLDEDIDKVNKVLLIGHSTVFFEDKAFANNSKYDLPSIILGDMLSSNEVLAEDVTNIVYVTMLIDEIKDFLNNQELEVLKLQLEGHSQTYVADRLGLSQMKVSRIKKKIANLLTEFTDLNETCYRPENKR